MCIAGHALLLDARSLHHEQVPLGLEPRGLILLIVNTHTARRLADGRYAARRMACQRAAALLGITALRDVPLADLEHALSALPEAELRGRVRHVVTENARVLEAAAVLRAGQPTLLGPILTASHASLRDDYEVSSTELDVAVEAAMAAGAIGARLTGAGFGGCVIALVPSERVGDVTAEVERAFARRGLAAPQCTATTGADGARRLPTTGMRDGRPRSIAG